MSKKENFKAVAVVNFPLSDKNYYFAIYEDGTDYKAGDKVYVSGESGIVIIKSILTPEEYEEKTNSKSITAEVICKIDDSAYQRRIEERKKIEDVKSKLDQKRKEMDSLFLDEFYANKSKEYRSLLNEYNTLTGQLKIFYEKYENFQ